MAITIQDERLSGTRGAKKPCAVITWPFTTDVSGDASEESITLNGRIERVATNPDNTDTPTTNWDLTIEDEDGIDVLGAAGANRDPGGTGASEQIKPDVVVASKVTFKVANGGNAKKGVVKLYIV